MKLLVLGGTRFVGRHLVEAALDRGHELTLFNRGITNPHLFPGVERIPGDRGGDLSGLSGRRWDVAVDVNGYLPGFVRAAAERLAGAVDRYVFVSTVSVYAGFRQTGLTEEAPLKKLPDGGTNAGTVTRESYGGLKALCESAVREILPQRSLIVRPGLVAGPHDPTGRFPYWPWRVARGGEVLAPESPDLPVQLIDARDLGEWIVRCVEAGEAGTYNAVGPGRPLTFGEVLETCREVAGSDARFTWVDRDFLLENDVEPFTGVPLWLGGPEAIGFNSISNQKAVSAGLTFRPLADTVRDTLAWLDELGGEIHRSLGADYRGPLPPEREADLLRKWRARS